MTGKPRNPSGWRIEPLKNVTRKAICYGIVQTGPSVDGGIPCLRVVDLADKALSVQSMITTSEDIHRRYKRTILEKGDVVFALRGDIGRSRLVPDNLLGANITRGLARLSPKKEVVLPEYLLQLLNSPSTNREILFQVNGSALKEVPIGGLEKVKVSIPPLLEQKEIISILSTWDTAIETTQHLIDAKKKLKKGLMQQLLTGKRRFPCSESSWKTSRIHEVTVENRERNSNGLGIQMVKAVNKQKGLIPMKERVIGSSLDRYKVVQPSDFAYNPMRLNIGSIAFSREDEPVLVSPDYVVFSCREDALLPDYFNHYRHTADWRRILHVAGNGSVRVRIYYKDLSKMKIRLPSVVEQRKVAGVLDTLDQEISLLQKELKCFQDQKKGLMQRLLTGQVRVKTDSKD